MWKKIAPLLVILSVSLNIAFVSVWAAHVVRGHWLGSRRCGDEDGRGGVWRPMHRRLNVTAEQWRKIEPRVRQFQQGGQAVCRDISRLRGELVNLIAAAEPDRKAIAAKQEEILAGQRRMQGLVIEHILAEKELLTPDQWKNLFDLLRRRTGCGGHGPMMGIRLGGGPPVQESCGGERNNKEGEGGP